MKLSTWAKKVGLTYTTAYSLFRNGNLPLPAIQLSTGTILIDENAKSSDIPERVVLYCRVSNHSRKKEIEYQVKRCEDFAIAKGYTINKVYKEIASGMNDNRTQLWKMLDSKPTKIIIENKDRLTRFGFNYLDKLLKNSNCDIEVINEDKVEETDLLKDLVSIITSFCCRIYGARRGQNKAKAMMDNLND